MAVILVELPKYEILNDFIVREWTNIIFDSSADVFLTFVAHNWVMNKCTYIGEVTQCRVL